MEKYKIVPTLFFIHRRRAFLLYFFPHTVILSLHEQFMRLFRILMIQVPRDFSVVCLTMEAPKIIDWLKNLGFHLYMLFYFLLTMFENDHYNVIIIRKFLVTMI